MGCESVRSVIWLGRIARFDQPNLGKRLSIDGLRLNWRQRPGNRGCKRLVCQRRYKMTRLGVVLCLDFSFRVGNVAELV